ncbi:MAG: DAK2 domain-containing protein [Clostridia bacterium]
MKTIDNIKLKEMLLGGAKFLTVNKTLVDTLNVFPVPDGDTGTNMSLTIASAVNEVNSLKENEIDDIAKAFARGALKGARGNSGVILSQIFKGFSLVLADCGNVVTTKVFAKALISATEIAYRAVTKPKEGTILTVIRVIAENATNIAYKNVEFVDFLKQILAKGNEILSKTPDMLPVLKEAGVVDAGGKGLVCVIEGMYRVLAGIELPEQEIEVSEAESKENFAGEIHDLGNIKFAYCTEYFIVNLKKSVTEEDVAKLRDKLLLIGDCVIVIGDVYLIKVHVHTNQPNRALGLALQLGELDKIKVENMLQQNRNLMQEKEKNKKPIAMLSICTGDGVSKIFKDLNVDYIIEGGQTMNPSVEDILSAVERINSDNIVILPNNKNIILAAEQAKELTSKNCVIVPTTNVPEGISSAIVFDVNSTIEDNFDTMNVAKDTIKCGMVTYAVRTTEIDGFDLHEGDIIGLDDKKIIAKSNDVAQTTKDVVNKIMTEDEEIISLYYGDNVTKEQAESIRKDVEAEHPDCEVCCYYGGQPHYYFMISIE